MITCHPLCFGGGSSQRNTSRLDREGVTVGEVSERDRYDMERQTNMRANDGWKERRSRRRRIRERKKKCNLNTGCVAVETN
jgi:hypothetical protein